MKPGHAPVFGNILTDCQAIPMDPGMKNHLSPDRYRVPYWLDTVRARWVHNGFQPTGCRALRLEQLMERLLPDLFSGA